MSDVIYSPCYTLSDVSPGFSGGSPPLSPAGFSGGSPAGFFPSGVFTPGPPFPPSGGACPPPGIPSGAPVLSPLPAVISKAVPSDAVPSVYSLPST